MQKKNTNSISSIIRILTAAGKQKSGCLQIKYADNRYAKAVPRMNVRISMTRKFLPMIPV